MPISKQQIDASILKCWPTFWHVDPYIDRTIDVLSSNDMYDIMDLAMYISGRLRHTHGPYDLSFLECRPKHGPYGP